MQKVLVAFCALKGIALTNGLGKVLEAPFPATQSSRTLGVHKDIGRTRGGWQQFITAGFAATLDTRILLVGQ